MHKLLYKKLLHGPRNLVKVGKNGRRLVLNVVCRFEKIKTFIKTRFASKIIMLEKTMEFKQTLSLVMEGKRRLFYNKEFQRPKCGLLQRQNYFYFKPYGNMLCYESVP
jgi:hypothetical protein